MQSYFPAPLILAAALLSLNLSSPAQTCDPAPSGVVSWWSGESNAFDNFGINNGIYNGTPAYAPGKIGTAFSFNGSSQYVRVPDSSSLHFGAVTVEAWVNLTTYNSGSSSSVIVKYSASGQPNSSSWSFGVDGPGPGFCGVSLDGVNGNFVYTTTKVPTNTWTHLAATYDGANLVIYFNGVQQGSISLPGTMYSGNADLGIGANVGNVTDGSEAGLFHGLIDEPTVYNRALSASEILAIYQAGAAGKCPSIPVSIITGPSDTNVTAGQVAQFSITTTGSQPVTYQWYFNGTNILGATSSTLTLLYVQTSQAGQYYCSVSNAASAQAINSFPANLGVSPAPSCDPAPSGLVSWWAGEGNAFDNLGINRGALIGSPGFTPGIAGQAFNFNGLNQYVLVTNSPSLQFSNLSVSAWIFPTAYNGQDSAILCKYGAFINGQDSFDLYVAPDGHGAFIASKDGNNIAAIATTSDLCSTNTWTHLAATYDGTNINIYFNGSLEASAPMTGSIFRGTYNLGIGANINGITASFFSGAIDEPAIFNRALSAAEISAIYNAGASSFCSLPITFTSQPTNQTVPSRGQAVFNCTVIGSQPLAFQWYFNGTNLSGATNSTLVLTNVSVNQSGNYYAIASNPFGGVVAGSNATLTVLPPPVCVNPPPNLVSWWSGESNTLDNAGGNNGIPVGASVFAPGKVNQAFSFDGANEYIRVPDSSNLHFSNAMTAEAWIYPLSYNPGSSSSVLDKWDAVAGINQRSWSFGIDGPAPGFFGISTNGSGGTFVFTTNIIPTNVWTHLAATYDGTQLTIYFNGVAQATTPCTGNIFSGNDDMGIGANIGGGGPIALFKGLIDEPTVYNRALSSNEIKAIYTADLAGKCATFFPITVSISPTPARISPGGTASLNAQVTGTPPLSYQWQFNGTKIPGATNRSLTVTNISMTNSGAYTLQVSNGPVSVSNASVQVELLLASVLGNNVLLTNTQNIFTNSVTIKLTNYYPGGDIFYTLDGSAPTPESPLYTGPFVLTNNAAVRTLAFSPDFQQYSVSDPVGIVFPAIFNLSATTAGGGTISHNPPGSSYPVNTSVTLTAIPSNGWTFLQWTGDIGGNNPANSLIMDHNRSIQAVFGTAVSNIAGGSGSITFNPPGGIYPFGTILQASAIPQSGNFFVIWGDNASGNANPLAFPVTNANQTISALFYALDPGEVALAVIPVGPGTVSVSPQANSYSSGAQVAVTATPASGKSFVGWSGNASGTNNPLNVTLNQSATIYANFATNSALVIYPVTAPGTADGVALDLLGQPGAHYRLDASSNLITWTNLYDLTNYVGTLHYIDQSATNLAHRYYHSTILP